MKVKILATGNIEDYDYSYAARLIEQGKAIAAPAENKAKKDKTGKEAGKGAGEK